MVSFPTQASSSQQRTPAKSEADKSCCQWKYYSLVPATNQTKKPSTPTTNVVSAPKITQCSSARKEEILFRPQIQHDYMILIFMQLLPVLSFIVLCLTHSSVPSANCAEAWFNKTISRYGFELSPISFCK